MRLESGLSGLTFLDKRLRRGIAALRAIAATAMRSRGLTQIPEPE